MTAQQLDAADIQVILGSLYATAAVDLAGALGAVGTVLDNLVEMADAAEACVVIPEPVRNAVGVLAAYGVALAANSNGRPCPEPYRSQLQLDAPAEPCQAPDGPCTCHESSSPSPSATP